jgi:4-carboxymuconolactone decarboxylase
MTERTYAERHAAAHDLLSTMAPGADPERVTTGMVRRHGALGSFAMDYVLGDLWCRPQLSRRDRSLIVITYLATLGSTEELAAHVRNGLNHGLSRSEIEEIVLQVAAYAGYPTALPAARVMDSVFRSIDGVERLPAREPAVQKDDATRRADATEVMSKLFAGRTPSDPVEARRNIVEQLGGVGELAFDWAFGEVWSRNELARRDRSMVTLAVLAMLGRHDEFRVHVRGALNHGCTAEEVEEIMVQLTVYGGFPRAVEAMRATREILAKASK